ncbi:hypothetical protein BYT27DRAFT_7112844, partial [Phlegmacium glaucopus]
TKYKVKHFERPTTLRLIQIDMNNQVAEEAVFTIQGVLSAKNLPPIELLMRGNSQTVEPRTSSQARYLCQGIGLVGYGTTTFEKAISSTQEIYGIFDRNVQDASLESWALTTSTVQGSIFEASNRYLTLKRDTPDMQPVSISPLVDPHSILKRLTKEGFWYEEENNMHYYQVHKSIFRIGDIVEAQVLFIAVPLKDNKHKMLVILRSIALLDTQFSQVRAVS